MSEFLTKLKNVKLILFDLKGVLADSEIINDKKNLKNFYSGLSTFSKQIKKLNMLCGIITADDKSRLTEQLGECGFDEILTSSIEKVSLAEKLILKYNINFNNVFYIGDEILDIPLLQKVGLSASPKHARREVKREVDHIFASDSGQEILDDLLSLLQKAHT